VRNFYRQYRKLSAFAALLLFIAVLLAIKYHFDNKPILSDNDTPSSQLETKKTATAIVRTGLVGIPTLVPINTGFSGRISELYVKEGQAVKAGQPLFKLEATFITAETSSDLKVNSGTAEYSRLKKLYDLGIISRKELENAGTRQQTTRKSSSSGQSTSPAPAITDAPVEGIVTGLAVASGSAVQADQLILSLGSGQPIEVVIPLTQKELYWVQPGTPAVVEIAGHTILGEVSSIFPEVKENAIASFIAHINLINPPPGLVQVGMSANVSIDAEP